MNSTHLDFVGNDVGNLLGEAREILEMYYNLLNSLVGDAGVEPTTFGSGDQRSIHLS